MEKEELHRFIEKIGNECMKYGCHRPIIEKIFQGTLRYIDNNPVLLCSDHLIQPTLKKKFKSCKNIFHIFYIKNINYVIKIRYIKA